MIPGVSLNLVIFLPSSSFVNSTPVEITINHFNHLDKVYVTCGGHYSTVRVYLNLLFFQDVQAESLSFYGKLKSNDAVEYITTRRGWSLDQHFPQSVSRHD